MKIISISKVDKSEYYIKQIFNNAFDMEKYLKIYSAEKQELKMLRTMFDDVKMYASITDNLFLKEVVLSKSNNQEKP